VLLVAHALTPSLRHQVLGGDDEPDDAGLLAVSNKLGASAVLSSPARAAVRTAEAFGAVPSIEHALRDREYGEWTGKRYAELAAAQPDAVRRWLDDPSWAPPGGESVVRLVERVGAWLAHADTSVTAVTHPAVIRAAVVYVLRAPPASYRLVDVRPLSRARFSRQGDRWTFALD
jgi:broad specificity phosphatase PhoE